MGKRACVSNDYTPLHCVWVPPYPHRLALDELVRRFDGKHEIWVDVLRCIETRAIGRGGDLCRNTGTAGAKSCRVTDLGVRIRN